MIKISKAHIILRVSMDLDLLPSIAMCVHIKVQKGAMLQGKSKSLKGMM